MTTLLKTEDVKEIQKPIVFLSGRHGREMPESESGNKDRHDDTPSHVVRKGEPP